MHLKIKPCLPHTAAFLFTAVRHIFIVLSRVKGRGGSIKYSEPVRRLPGESGWLGRASVMTMCICVIWRESQVKTRSENCRGKEQTKESVKMKQKKKQLFCSAAAEREGQGCWNTTWLLLRFLFIKYLAMKWNGPELSGLIFRSEEKFSGEFGWFFFFFRPEKFSFYLFIFQYWVSHMTWVICMIVAIEGFTVLQRSNNFGHHSISS